MKYLNWFKGFVFISLACSVSAQGSAFMFSGLTNDPQKQTCDPSYSIAVTAGQDENSQASANLTISGDRSQVKVEKEGTVTLTAGKSIILRPGTRISHGSFLYASIEAKSKSGKHQKKEVKLVTVEEKKKIEEQASFAVAYDLFSPFPSGNRGILNKGDAENGSFTSSGNELSGVSPEQQRKVAVDACQVSMATGYHSKFTSSFIPVSSGYRTETARVLRL